LQIPSILGIMCDYRMNEMKKTTLALIISLFILSLVPISADQRKPKTKDLPPAYREWIEEEVVYIITEKEKDVFLQLQSDKERNIFIEAFWKQRDPTPNMPKNEFKTEHYRRISYANNWFGRQSPSPGWRTARGRIYITLGEAKTIDRFENMSEVYPVIIWFYEGLGEMGLPNAFSVAFFKKDGVGEYRLYSPLQYGPQGLMVNYMGDPSDYVSAYRTLMNIEPDIANVSLTLIQQEKTLVPRPSMASEILINTRIPAAPTEKVKDTYAEKLLRYKDVIEVDYSANYMDNDFCVDVLQDRQGHFFVHYLLEPSKFSVEPYEDKFHANLEINGNVTDMENRSVYQFERRVPIEFNREQIEQISDKLFSFQDMFPLVQGNYRVSVILKNSVSKEFTSIEKDVNIPSPSSLQMSSLVLANRVIENSRYSGQNKAYLIGSRQLVPSPRNDFVRTDTLHLYFQIFGLNESLKQNGKLKYTLERELTDIPLFTKNISDYADGRNFYESIALTEYSPANYKLKVSVLDGQGQEVLAEQDHFFISHFPSLPRAWTLGIPMAPSSDPMYSNILGKQYWQINNIERAATLLEEAHRSDPNSDLYALDYCRVLLNRKDYRKIKAITQPFLQGERRNNFLMIMGQSSQALSEYAEAITLYKEYLDHFGTNINVLNNVGTCYHTLGNMEEALIAWEKSLEIEPDQEVIRQKVEAIIQ